MQLSKAGSQLQQFLLVMLFVEYHEILRFILGSMSRLGQLTSGLKSGWDGTRELNVAEGADRTFKHDQTPSDSLPSPYYLRQLEQPNCLPNYVKEVSLTQSVELFPRYRLQTAK